MEYSLDRYYLIQLECKDSNDSNVSNVSNDSNELKILNYIWSNDLLYKFYKNPDCQIEKDFEFNF